MSGLVAAVRAEQCEAPGARDNDKKIMYEEKHAEEFRRTSENITAQVGKVDVVVTHFPPILEAIDQELYNGDPFNPYFINDAKPLVQYVGAKLWVSGHTHSPFDYQVGATRVVGNPRGYKEEPPRPGFSVMKTVEV